MLMVIRCLRALLIQKDTKRCRASCRGSQCLRALLIQKDTKLAHTPVCQSSRLRALLIQKDTKQYCSFHCLPPV